MRTTVGQNAPFRFICRIKQIAPSLPHSTTFVRVGFSLFTFLLLVFIPSLTFARAGRAAPRYDALRKQREGRAHGLSRFCANLP